MDNNDLGIQIGIRIIITQETNEFSHRLFEVFNVREFINNRKDLEKDAFFDVLNNLKNKSLELIKSIEKS